jgi:hypothetical protein
MRAPFHARARLLLYILERFIRGIERLPIDRSSDSFFAHSVALVRDAIDRNK